MISDSTDVAFCCRFTAGTEFDPAWDTGLTEECVVVVVCSDSTDVAFCCRFAAGAELDTSWDTGLTEECVVVVLVCVCAAVVFPWGVGSRSSSWLPFALLLPCVSSGVDVEILVLRAHTPWLCGL